jgi:hypothetical protein
MDRLIYFNFGEENMSENFSSYINSLSIYYFEIRKVYNTHPAFYSANFNIQTFSESNNIIISHWGESYTE